MSNEVNRVPFEVSGLSDSVELMTVCSSLRMRCDESGTPVEMDGKPEICPCRIMASYEDGTLTFSVRKLGWFISARIDEVMEVLVEAGKASKESNRED